MTAPDHYQIYKLIIDVIEWQQWNKGESRQVPVMQLQDARLDRNCCQVAINDAEEALMEECPDLPALVAVA
jgi:hypothetical protein